MSPPSANTRMAEQRSAKTPPPSGKGLPSTGQSHLSARSASKVAISDSSLEAESIDEKKRRELLELFMNPKAHQDPIVRGRFSQKLAEYAMLARLDPSDILLRIATSNFGMKKFKVVLIGGGGVGKSAFVSRLSSGRFEYTKYQPTRGAEVTSVVLPTNKDYTIQLEIWDCSGIDKNGGLLDGYYLGADAAIMMHDATTASYNALDGLYKDLTRVCSGNDIPIVVVSSKVDLKKTGSRKKKAKTTFQRKRQLRGFEVSAKIGRGMELPLLYLVKQLTGDNKLNFLARTLAGELELSSGDEEAIARGTGKLSLEDRPPTPRADVAAASAVSLPESGEGGL